MGGVVFAHGVASGDPLDDRIVIWTRVTTEPRAHVPVTWWMATEDGHRVADGVVEASPGHDHTVQVDVVGLEAGRSYRYGFEALGEVSPEGLSRTLPGQNADHIRFGQVSCAKFNSGFFNAYSRLADRDDLDFVLHLGDYIYEASQTPPASQTPGADIGRPFDPLHECRTLADYRRRYAQYRADPDLQRFHARHPIVATWDDHEFADGAWRDGANEHREDRDGSWAARTSMAMQARWEWLPARPPEPEDPSRVFRAVAIGSIADLFLVDTRTRRDRPVPSPDMFHAARSNLGAEQRAWLADGLRRSTAAWRFIGNPSVLARTWNDRLPTWVRSALAKVKLIDADLTGPDWDQWDGYPVERQWLLNLVRDDPTRNVVVLSGDVHVAMVNELRTGEVGETVAVEFVNTSITSPNLDEKMRWKPLTESLAVAEAFEAGMPHVRWCDFDSHGYSVIDATAGRVISEWWAVDTILARSAGERLLAAWEVRAGTIVPVQSAGVSVSVGIGGGTAP